MKNSRNEAGPLLLRRKSAFESEVSVLYKAIPNGYPQVGRLLYYITHSIPRQRAEMEKKNSFHIAKKATFLAAWPLSCGHHDGVFEVGN